MDQHKKDSLTKSITQSALFQHLKEDEMEGVFESLFPSEASADEIIIKQGDEGDNFYIIDEVKELFETEILSSVQRVLWKYLWTKQK